MARVETVTYTDDVTGDQIEEGKGGTVHFALDGSDYEVDLSDKSRRALVEALEPYVKVARRSSRSGEPYKRVSLGPSNQELRDWARQNGMTVPERGRIPQRIREAFDAR